MNHFFHAFLIIALLLPHKGLAQQEVRIASAAITFEFPSKKVKGSIEGFQSNAIIDRQQPGNSVFEGSVAVKTLDTGIGFRNWVLRGRKYFDEDNHPQIHFKSNEVVEQNGAFIVKGTLTLKGISKPLTITFNEQGNRLVGNASLYSIDHDIKIKKKREDNLVNINFVFVLAE
ncbi:YceI family protein [Allomuricauda sp. SCSIO 65647]|uniref:YceI family protein n=1 Tax=Allomuricauda sp. SCSIO 65647 TaxID=2908843 RepID=UPI001F4848B7|nr:YceI family protein [Muricauda sp. SCSIO 65647]UJH67392.1 YceI family protein [Muricauda sp. SCSIO 65647]